MRLYSDDAPDPDGDRAYGRWVALSGLWTRLMLAHAGCRDAGRKRRLAWAMQRVMEAKDRTWDVMMRRMEVAA